jgi:hypothetical protein
MKFEKVYTIREFHDDIRSGTANFMGVPHYFASLLDDTKDIFLNQFCIL